MNTNALFRNVAAASALLILGCGEPPPKTGGNNGVNNGGNNGVNNGGNNGANNGANNGGTFIDPSTYDRACEWDSECALVWGGDVCVCGAICPSAIAQSAVEQFQADVAAADCSMAGDPPCPGAACQEMKAVCSNGTCETIPRVVIDAADFDQSCETVDDCMLISVGEVCSDCSCATAGINVSEAERLQSILGEVSCSPGPQVCDCAPATQLDCVEGFCTVGF